MGVKRDLVDNISKLPKWAQEHIKHLGYQRDAAVLALNNFRDIQTPTMCWFEEHPCTGEEAGPSLKRWYLQTREVTMLLGKEEVTMRLGYDGDGITISAGWNTLGFKPVASNTIEIFEVKR